MWRIGQRVVYIGKDLDFDPNPGKTIHTIVGVRQGCCSRCPLDIDVGIRFNRPNDASVCHYCGSKDFSNIFWKSTEVFRPVQDQYTEQEIEAVNIDELTEEMVEV